MESSEENIISENMESDRANMDMFRAATLPRCYRRRTPHEFAEGRAKNSATGWHGMAWMTCEGLRRHDALPFGSSGGPSDLDASDPAGEIACGRRGRRPAQIRRELGPALPRRR